VLTEGEDSSFLQIRPSQSKGTERERENGENASAVSRVKQSKMSRYTNSYAFRDLEEDSILLFSTHFLLLTHLDMVLATFRHAFCQSITSVKCSKLRDQRAAFDSGDAVLTWTDIDKWTEGTKSVGLVNDALSAPDRISQASNCEEPQELRHSLDPIILYRRSISSGHRPFCAIPDAGTVTI
jgi:hypothetical protein